jgi:Domain of unknown function (DUF5069)
VANSRPLRDGSAARVEQPCHLGGSLDLLHDGVTPTCPRHDVLHLRELVAERDREMRRHTPDELVPADAHRIGGDNVRRPTYYSAAGEPKSIWKVPGSKHTGGIDARPAEYERRVIAYGLPQAAHLGTAPWLPRMIDEARVARAGTLGPDYRYPCPIDRASPRQLGLDADTFANVAQSAQI